MIVEFLLARRYGCPGPAARCATSFWPTAPDSTWSTQGPAALTSSRARTSSARAARAYPQRRSRQASPSRRALHDLGAGADHRTRDRRRRAALSTTSRASFDPAIGILEAALEKRLQRLAGRIAAQVERRASPAAACARRDGRRERGRAGAARPAAGPRACGSTKRSGQMMCGAMRHSTSRSISASRTSRNS